MHPTRHFLRWVPRPSSFLRLSIHPSITLLPKTILHLTIRLLVLLLADLLAMVEEEATVAAAAGHPRVHLLVGHPRVFHPRDLPHLQPPTIFSALSSCISLSLPSPRSSTSRCRRQVLKHLEHPPRSVPRFPTPKHSTGRNRKRSATSSSLAGWSSQTDPSPTEMTTRKSTLQFPTCAEPLGTTSLPISHTLPSDHPLGSTTTSGSSTNWSATSGYTTRSARLNKPSIPSLCPRARRSPATSSSSTDMQSPSVGETPHCATASIKVFRAVSRTTSPARPVPTTSSR